MFREIEPIPNLPEMEKEKIKYWDKIGVVERLKELRKDAEERVYYDGPITANNLPHYGHVVTWTLKDIVPRYWSMKGYFVSRNMGWDCQGLAVEVEVEKELGFSNKKDIEKIGVAKFNELCRVSVLKYQDEIFKYEKRIGRWFDETDMYYTMDKNYIESMWWSFKTLYDKGLIYKGYKVVPYSPKAGTPLSQHEVADGGYEEIEDPFVAVKFELKNEPKTFFLAWTTTPWTMPGNLMLAVGKKLKYAKVSADGNNYILAESKVEEFFTGKNYKVVEKLGAKDLEGLEYIPPFNFYEGKRAEGCFKVVFADHVSDEEGTGIVHLAPYGEEDFNLFMKLGINLFDYLDSEANFTNEIPKYARKFYKDANTDIIGDLDAGGVLFSTGTITHRMPICWRTKVPLIYKPIESWYVAVTKLKAKMLEQNEKINWVPEHIKTGMSFQWINNARDWAISRSRYWGTPMPVWMNDKTGEVFVAGSFAEVEKLSGAKIDDPHKPFVDEITWEKGGGTFRRIPDVLDAWYDSGSVPFAKLHYPFENRDLIDKKIKFPASYIAEGDDQVRLWFYTMHVLGVGLFGEVPYENVVVNGMMTAKDGEKLSKSKKNFPPMDEVLGTFGADVLRLFILNSPIVQAETARFYEEALDEVRKNFSIILWNSLRYFTTYANSNNWAPIRLEAPESENVLDQWILIRLKQTALKITENMDAYHFMNASRELLAFVQDLSTWYIRRSRDRIRSGDENAISTLYYVLATLSKLMAPMVPFMAEELYSVLDVKKFSGLDSVHLDIFPQAEALTAKDEKILAKMELTRKVVSLALSAREAEGIKIRQPLGTLRTNSKDIYEDLVKDEVNVKEIVFEDGGEGTVVKIDTELTDELKLEGSARELIRKIQGERKKMNLAVDDVVSVVVEDSDENKKVLEILGEDIKSKVLAKSLEFGETFGIKKTS